jgi:hypothetical protein
MFSGMKMKTPPDWSKTAAATAPRARVRVRAPRPSSRKRRTIFGDFAPAPASIVAPPVVAPAPPVRREVPLDAFGFGGAAMGAPTTTGLAGGGGFDFGGGRRRRRRV